MNNSRKYIILISIFISTIFSLTINVGSGSNDDYSTIQGAIDAAADGDSVSVSPGTYTENLIIESDITLMSVGNAGNTSIVGTDGCW